jgi:hypothetical protein
MGEKKDPCRISVGNLEVKRQLGRPRHRWAVIIETDLRGILLDWIDLAQNMDQWGGLLRTR